MTEEKKTRKSKNTPELLNDYLTLFNYYYYEKGYNKNRDYIHKVINKDLLDKKHNNELKDFLKNDIKINSMFNKIPRHIIQKFLNDKFKKLTQKQTINTKEINNKDDIKISNLVKLTDSCNIQHSNDNVYRVIKIMRPKKNLHNPILYKILQINNIDNNLRLLKRFEIEPIKKEEINNKDDNKIHVINTIANLLTQLI